MLRPFLKELLIHVVVSKMLPLFTFSSLSHSFCCLQDVVTEVQRTLYATLSEFDGDLDNENDLEILIAQQFEALQKALKIPNKASEARTMVSKKFLTLFRAGKLGPFILDDVPDVSAS